MINFDGMVEEKGCEFCAKYDWEKHEEVLKTFEELKQFTINGKYFYYCPFCGRKIKGV